MFRGALSLTFLKVSSFARALSHIVYGSAKCTGCYFPKIIRPWALLLYEYFIPPQESR